MATAFQIAARQRWPGYTVQGEGEWAVVCPILKLITLYDFALLAEVDAQQPHSNWNCAVNHRVERIKPAQQKQQQYQPAHSAGYGKD